MMTQCKVSNHVQNKCFAVDLQVVIKEKCAKINGNSSSIKKINQSYKNLQTTTKSMNWEYPLQIEIATTKLDGCC